MTNTNEKSTQFKSQCWDAFQDTINGWQENVSYDEAVSIANAHTQQLEHDLKTGKSFSHWGIQDAE